MTRHPIVSNAHRSRRELLLSAAAAVLLLLWDLSGLDLTVSAWFGGPQGFVLREAWWTRDLLHEGGRRLAMLVLVLFLIDCLRPFARGTGTVHGPNRRERWLWFGATLASLVVVPGIKRFSATSCPWDLSLFGGMARYVSHWQIGVADGGGGHCFPSGHAVSAFAFFSVYFLWRDHRPQLARMMLIAVLLLGGLFGFAQLVRGAHYPSHVLWSGWLCWTLCVGWARFGDSKQIRAATLQ
jgi:membrane-associated PAP2 superfamily phosphatase